MGVNLKIDGIKLYRYRCFVTGMFFSVISLPGVPLPDDESPAPTASQPVASDGDSKTTHLNSGI